MILMSLNLVESVALLVARRTNNRKVVGSRPTKVVCITVLTGNRLGWTVRCGRPPLLLPSCRKLEFRLSALMYSDLALVNSKSGSQSWCYADAFQRSVISGAIYHFTRIFGEQRGIRLGYYVNPDLSWRPFDHETSKILPLWYRHHDRETLSK